MPNWLDTAGYTEGTIWGRWYDCSSTPLPTIKRVPFADRDAMKKLVDPVMAAYAKEIGAGAIYDQITAIK